MTLRLAYLVTHPIQYQAPLLRRIAAEPDIDLHVFFGSDFSVRAFVDADFGRAIAWDVPLTEGYSHEFLIARGPPMRPGEAPGFRRPDTEPLGPLLARGRFDALWVHGYHRLPHLAAIRDAKRLGLKVLLRDEVNAQSNDRHWAKEAAKQALVRLWLARAVDAFLCIGSANRAYWRALGAPARKLFDMPYAVDNAVFQARAAEAAGRRESLRWDLELEPGRPIVLFAAKMIDRKRPLDLVAAQALLEADPACRRPYLLFAGDGPLTQAATAEAARLGLSGVRLLGFQSQAQLAALYDLCDVFALPSEREAWGLVVNEAMCAARPVVCSDRIGAAADLVIPGETGFVHKVGDVPGLAAALKTILADPARAAAMGAAAKARIDEWDFAADLRGLRQALGLGGGG